MAENSALLNGLPAGYDSVQNLGQQMFGEYNLPMLNNMVFSDVGGFNYVNNPQNVFSPAQPYDYSVNYYQESCKLYIANVVLTNQIKELLSEKNDLLSRLNRLEMVTVKTWCV
eukprot:TRINITY_DN1879_c0_g1_i3.p1 TRINITY_DN1879_c0_g1~~TRINITY_DN1879_c0_g1_i3.p1  ORF type:complete len:113 (+),score=15.20 TRINITY_DN1879_c0_g1_i3:145-483(+)